MVSFFQYFSKAKTHACHLQKFWAVLQLFTKMWSKKFSHRNFNRKVVFKVHRCLPDLSVCIQIQYLIVQFSSNHHSRQYIKHNFQILGLISKEIKCELEIILVDLKLFSKIKCILHLVEFDQLFPKIGIRDLKTACGWCGAHTKVRKLRLIFGVSTGHVISMMYTVYSIRNLQNISFLFKYLSRDLWTRPKLSVISGLRVGATPPTSGFEVSNLEFREQLIELYKMYNALFSEKFSNLPSLFLAPK